jgi:hypothetical protein
MRKDTFLTKFAYFQAFTHAFVHHLDKGPWFISILNDNDRSLTFRLRAQPSDTSRCPQRPRRISPAGFAGYSGQECGQAVPSLSGTDLLTKGPKYQNKNQTTFCLWRVSVSVLIKVFERLKLYLLKLM